MKRYVLLDRDGTINREVNYLSDPAQVELYAGTGPGLRQMLDLDLGLIMMTNQSGLGRGYFRQKDLDKVQERLMELLADFEVVIDGIYVCPHRPEEYCHCRKPRPGMVYRAAAEFGFNPKESFVIGDKACDIGMGRTVGATTILVRTGYGNRYEKLTSPTPDFIVDDLLEAASTIKNCLIDEQE